MILELCLGLLMGIIMGLLGGGGSVLSVPIFLYVFKFPAIEATAYSLLVVGLSASFASIRNYRQGHIDFRNGLVFAIPSTLLVMLTRGFILPALPDQLLGVSKNDLLIYSFIIFLLFSGAKMFLDKSKPDPNMKYSLWSVSLKGALVGLATGFVGAGGGFLIVPALSLLLKFPMSKAIGTSLFIISINSILGFFSSVSSLSSFDWRSLVPFFLLSLLGVFLGQNIGKKVDNKGLKKGFAYFILLMALIMLIVQIVKLTNI